MKKLLLVAAVLAACSATPGLAQSVDSATIILSLTPNATQPGPTGGTLSASDRSFVINLLGGNGPNLDERSRLRQLILSNNLPSLDLSVYFDLNSSVIRPQALSTLFVLGQAISSNQLDDWRFIVSGHTDARGSNEYNQLLSEDRAQAVKRFLVQNFNIDPSRLIAVGFGEEFLRNENNPNADENRRVTVVNLTF